jgi:hypothetical protein
MQVRPKWGVYSTRKRDCEQLHIFRTQARIFKVANPSRAKNK